MNKNPNPDSRIIIDWKKKNGNNSSHEEAERTLKRNLFVEVLSMLLEWVLELNF